MKGCLSTKCSRSALYGGFNSEYRHSDVYTARTTTKVQLKKKDHVCLYLSYMKITMICTDSFETLSLQLLLEM